MAVTIGRRELLAALGGAAAAWVLAAHAQQPAKLPTIGVLVSGMPSSHGQWVAAFVRRLHEIGWIEGLTVAIEYRWAEGRTERAAEIAAEFVGRKVDVIVTSGRASAIPISLVSRRARGITRAFVRRLTSKKRPDCHDLPGGWSGRSHSAAARPQPSAASAESITSSRTPATGVKRHDQDNPSRDRDAQIGTSIVSGGLVCPT